jgi:hypothetical protein
MRSKCVHDKGNPPCNACRESGLPISEWYELFNTPKLLGECGPPLTCSLLQLYSVFPVRGQPDQDREYRHPRMRAEKSVKKDPAKVRRDVLSQPSPSPVQLSHVDDWELLPPLEEVIEGVNNFTRHYFQLGFIPKQRFPERLRQDPRSISPFLLLSILSISARFTAPLVARYGGGLQAVNYFMERAGNLAVNELYREPALERCQAYYLLSIAQQGSAQRTKSVVRMISELSISSL